LTRNSPRKAARMQELRAKAAQAEGPESGFVFGEGSPEAELMIVGEAPGAEEAEAGRPFVGAAGHLLDELLRRAGIDRNEIWLTNVVKHRPTRRNGDRLANRPPRVAEVAADAHWLIDEIATVQPKVILALGNLAAGTLIHKGFKMTEEHGLWYDGPGGAKAIATYHPAYALRQVGADRERVISEIAKDLAKAKAALSAYPSP